MILFATIIKIIMTSVLLVLRLKRTINMVDAVDMPVFWLNADFYDSRIN